jgi:hypothetical protein
VPLLTRMGSYIQHGFHSKGERARVGWDTLVDLSGRQPDTVRQCHIGLYY